MIMRYGVEVQPYERRQGQTGTRHSGQDSASGKQGCQEDRAQVSVQIDAFYYGKVSFCLN